MGAATVVRALSTSYVGSTLRKTETWFVAAIVAAVAACVTVLSRVPLSEQFEIDFREDDYPGGTAQATPSGLGMPGSVGRRNEAPIVSLLANRPLPQRFALWIDGQWQSPGNSGTVEVRAGASRKPMTFSKVGGLRGITVENPAGGRHIEIDVGAGKRLSMRRLIVSSAGVDVLP